MAPLRLPEWINRLPDWNYIPERVARLQYGCQTYVLRNEEFARIDQDLEDCMNGEVLVYGSTVNIGTAAEPEFVGHMYGLIRREDVLVLIDVNSAPDLTGRGRIRFDNFMLGSNRGQFLHAFRRALMERLDARYPWITSQECYPDLSTRIQAYVLKHVRDNQCSIYVEQYVIAHQMREREYEI